MAGLCADRVCIVTGAGRGIGREHALLLAREGAAVVVNDRGGAVDGVGDAAGPAQQVVAQILAAGGRAVADTEDIADFDGARRLVEHAIAAFGRLDVLVNNAGILRDRMLVSMAEDEWDAVVRVHLKGSFAPTHWAAAYWRDQAKSGAPVQGRVINTSSPSGLYGNVGQTNYGAAKAGIAALSVIAALELRRYGVTVNAIAPSALTRMTEGLGLVDPDDVELTAQLAPAWIAPLVGWLASEESADVTGRVFDVSGRALSVVDGWHRGPTVPPTADPSAVGELVGRLLGAARENATMTGLAPGERPDMLGAPPAAGAGS